MRLVIVGLSITSSWGNGHATTYRALVHALAKRGHDVLFLERDVPWYAENRDLPAPPYGRTVLYTDLSQLEQRHSEDVARADFVIVGSYVPDGVAIGRWVTETAGGSTAFYDIDTPVTLAKLERGEYEYLSPELIPRYDLYLSFTGGRTLRDLKEQWGARHAAPLYCSVDASVYRPSEGVATRWDLGYLGTYSADRQPKLERLLFEPARATPARFAVAGPQYPEDVAWPENVDHVEHLPPADHPWFYNAQRFTLNLTRADMVRAGYAPSVRLFEAAACGVPIISDWWEGLDTFFEPDTEILISESPEHVVSLLRGLPEAQRRAIGARARQRVLERHTADHRAAELERHARAALVEQR